MLVLPILQHKRHAPSLRLWTGLQYLNHPASSCLQWQRLNHQSLAIQHHTC